MSQARRVVISEKKPTNRLPEWANEAAVLLEWLHEKGLWTQASSRLRVPRQGGYCWPDVLLFLVCYFCSSLRCGLKEFGERTSTYRTRLAALGERASLATPASVSRFLSAVQPAAASSIATWLLLEATGGAEMLKHPCARSRDTFGDEWHCFDWDATVTVLRHRALPSGEDLPQAQRRSSELAQPGYSGRKRGDVQMSRSTLQHAGSGLWLHLAVGPGNGDLRGSLQSAVDAVREACGYAEVDAERAILRADGAAGHVPFIHACQAARIHYVTRLARYELLTQPEIARHLSEVVWYRVPSSGSGPERDATDLGLVTLSPGAETKQRDGSDYEPVEARIVVSRFRPTGGEKHGAGFLIEGWQYELFATGLPAPRWPAPELTACYYGRCGQENRFYQEDRELELDRILSYTCAGQELASLVGLLVWNLRICRGADLAQPPKDLLPQSMRHAEVAPEPAAIIEPSGTREAQAEATDSGGHIPKGIHSFATDAEADIAKAIDAVATDAETCIIDAVADSAPPLSIMALARAESLAPEPDAPRIEAPADAGQEADEIGPVKQALTDALEELDVSSLLAASMKPDWAWDSGKAGLICQNEALLPLVGIKELRNGPHLRFRALPRTCSDCASRSTCSTSRQAELRRELYLPVPSEQAQSLKDLVVAAEHARRRQATIRVKVEADARTKQPVAGSEPPMSLMALASAESSALKPDEPPVKAPADAGREADEVGPAKQTLAHALDEIDVPSLLASSTKPDWTWDSGKAGLICQNEALLPLVGIKELRNGPHLRFRALPQTCSSCASRYACSTSSDADLRRELYLPLPSDRAQGLEDLVVAAEQARRQETIRAKIEADARTKPKEAGTATPRKSAPATATATASTGSKPWHLSPVDLEPGPYGIASPALLPAELRKRFQRDCRVLETHVEVLLPPTTRTNPYVAGSDAERQHRRLTWSVRGRRTELPAGSTVTIEFAGGAAIIALVQRSAGAGDGARSIS